MSKSRGHGRWRSDGQNRMNIGPSVKGKPISNPIPFSEDDEFPFKPVGPGMPVSQGSEGVEKEKEMHLRLSADSTLRREGIDVFLDSLSIESETAPPQPSYAPPAPPTSQPTPLGVSTSIQSGSSARGRRPSLRNVFGKFFRRKHKPSASSTSGARAGQHRSVPTGLSRSPKGSLSKQRSASLPINEFNRALHSHSASTEEFPLASTKTSGDIIQANWQTRPRGATTPSGLWMPNRGYVDWTGLSPRPASSHARGSRVFHDDELEAAVGIALTSGSHPRRKSRSVGELRGTTSASNMRRRSDEIRYWRESYDPVVLSPVSTNKPEGEEADEQDVRGEEPPPQPFNFGLMGEMAGMKITQAASLETRVLRLEARVRGMEKVVFRSRSHASTDRLVFPDPPRRSSRRGRRTSLTLSATDHPEPSFAKRQESQETPRRQNSHAPVSRGSQNQSLYESSRPSTVSTNNSYYPFFDSASPPQLLTSPEQTTLNSSPNVARPLSTSTTIRGMPPSSPALPKDGHLTAEHYTALLNMILAEQAARHDLETVVVDLQARLRALHSAGTEHADPRRVGFSSSDPDNSSDDEGRFGHNNDDDDDDDFQTPAEERPEPPFGGEIFGEISSNRAAGPRIGPRTLSLSQMTLGKGGGPV